MGLQKKSFIETGESFLHRLTITLWKELGRLVQKYSITIQKTFFTICCETLFRILFQIWGYLITDTMIDNIESKIESLHVQECSLKNRSLWKLVISH